jgi:GDP-4-dehydro-6-deoxy-D-mannose reductase
MAAGTPGVVYNVASGEGRAIGDVLNALITRSRGPVRAEVDPPRVRANDAPMLIDDSTRLRRATGWQPEISFDRTIDDLLDYWRTVTAQTAG